MKKIFLLFLILFFQQAVRSQCTVSSSNGYDVNIMLNPIEIVPSTNNCKWGYNFNVKIEYSIIFSGGSPPHSLYTLQAEVNCGSFTNLFFDLPNSGGVGTITTTSNPWNTASDCATATPASLNCNIVDIQISGPGITTQAIDCPITPLPIELISFTADLIDDEYTRIIWQTGSELNNDYFTIERSRDAHNWEELIEIDGAGNSSQLLNYTTQDLSPYDGLSYYRLKQTDFNGQNSYSAIKAINKVEKGISKVTVYPNPTENLIFIKGDHDEISIIKIYNVFGQDISRFNIINSEIDHKSIDLSKLSKGLYILKTKTNIIKVYRK